MSLRDLGVAGERIEALSPCVDTEKFAPAKRDESIWRRLGVAQPKRLLYCGRVSVEKNVEMLADAFERLCAGRRDVALVFAGDGPHSDAMKRRLEGRPAHFVGKLSDDQLAALYASSDLL